MKNRKNYFILMAAVLAGIATMISCNCKNQNDVIPDVSFSNDLIPIFTTRCALNSSCHSGIANSGSNIDFDSVAAYNSIMNKHLVILSNPAASLLYVQVSSGIMPKAPNSPLASYQVTLILNWIKNGAKNN